MGAEPSIKYEVNYDDEYGTAFNPLFPDQKIEIDFEDYGLTVDSDYSDVQEILREVYISKFLR